MSETARGRERDRKTLFVVSFQLKLVYRTVMLFADWDRTSQYFMHKVGKICFFFLKKKKVTASLQISKGIT